VKTYELPKINAKDWSVVEFSVTFLGGHVGVSDSGAKLKTYKITNEVHQNFGEIVRNLWIL
jgi:hypothetical protein